MRDDTPRVPELPGELTETADPLGAGTPGELSLSGALLHQRGGVALRAQRVRIEESELHAVTLSDGRADGLLLTDVVLAECDFSNVEARQGALRRVEIRGSRLVGFTLTEGRMQDVRALDTTLAYASFARSRLHRVVFERVILREASFLDATLQAVAFIGCELAGADFRGASLADCTMIGSTLEGVVGVESLRGLTMGWPDVVGSAGALAAALGIAIKPDTPT